jgi:bisphosphoglycerate-dependent phosphoglycerate mutase
MAINMGSFDNGPANGNGNGKKRSSFLGWLLHAISTGGIVALLTLGLSIQKEGADRDRALEARLTRHEQEIQKLANHDDQQTDALRAAREYGLMQRQNMSDRIIRLEQHVDALEAEARQRRGYWPK